jgi:hypothetical protein
VTEPRPACALLLLLCTVRLSTVGTCSASCRLPPTGAAVRSPPAAGPPCCSAAAAAAGLLPVPVAAAAPPAQVHCCSAAAGAWGSGEELRSLEAAGRCPLGFGGARVATGWRWERRHDGWKEAGWGVAVCWVADYWAVGSRKNTSMRKKFFFLPRLRPWPGPSP